MNVADGTASLDRLCYRLMLKVYELSGRTASLDRLYYG